MFSGPKNDETKHKLEKYPRGTKENVENICCLKWYVFIENVCRSTVFEMYVSPLKNVTFNIGTVPSKEL